MQTLIVLLGPTGIGKTDLSINLAKYFRCPIISSDSRQFYREMKIGTAVPCNKQLSSVQHFFIHSRSIFDDYTAGKFETDAINLINKLFENNNFLLMVGGSGLYIDAVCKGIDEIPATEKSLRNNIIRRYKTDGIKPLLLELEKLDSDICNQIDVNNPQRVMRALEVCITAGKPYSELKQNFSKKRNFNTVKIGLQMDRAELYNRINKRVDVMFDEGLIEEAKLLYKHKDVNALQTVGYKEIFDFLDSKISIEQARNLVKRNTRRYAKRQISWFARYNDISWFSPNEFDEIVNYINEKIMYICKTCKTNNKN